MLVWMWRWQWCPRALGNFQGAGSLCGDSVVMVGSLALSLESLQDLPDSRAALFPLSQDKAARRQRKPLGSNSQGTELH